MRRIAIALFFGAVFTAGLIGRAAAATPDRINFQGKLLNTSKVPQNGSFSMTFAIFNAASGGTQLWTETQGAVSVVNGAFTVQLGASTPLTPSVFSSSTTYLQVTVAGETASTRQQLVTTPYTFRAAVADDLEPGDTNYIQVRTTLQSGATFYVSSGTVNGSLFADGVARVGGVINRDDTDTTVSGTAALSTLYSFTVPANIMGTNRTVKIIMAGTYTNNSGANRTLRLVMDFGGTLLVNKTSANVTTSATASDFFLICTLSNQNATNSQLGACQMLRDRAGTLLSPIIDTGTAAEDTTVDQTLQIRTAHSNASANISITSLNAYAVLE